MRFKKLGTPSTGILVAVILFFIATDTIVLAMNVRSRNETSNNYQRTSKSLKPVSEARQFGGESHFQNWKVWDRPEDQLAIETMNLGNPHPHQQRTKKLLHRNYTSPAEVVYVQEPSSAKASTGDGNNNGMQRNDCNNNNMQVSFLPVVLAIIAIIAGIIGIIVLWFIAKAFISTGGSNGIGYGASTQGWSGNNMRADTFGFARNFQNFDIDQLTNMVTKGIESYKKAFETTSTSA